MSTWMFYSKAPENSYSFSGSVEAECFIGYWLIGSFKGYPGAMPPTLCIYQRRIVLGVK